MLKINEEKLILSELVCCNWNYCTKQQWLLIEKVVENVEGNVIKVSLDPIM